jgi:hypothetical protein
MHPIHYRILTPQFFDSDWREKILEDRDTHNGGEMLNVQVKFVEVTGWGCSVDRG